MPRPLPRPAARAARLVLGLALLAVTNGCGGSSGPTAPTPLNVPYSQTDVVVGTGPAARAGDVISVNYVGWLYAANAPQNRGTLFDTSIGRAPFRFVLGAGQVIRGWDQGIPGMQVGGVRRLVLPPEFGYGATGSGPIPPNATLLFEVELLAIE